jgi:hypothetical protein
MIKTFTQNDVLRYIYDEVTPEEKPEIERALLQDIDLMEFYLEALETTESLCCVKKEPSDKSIENILNYSRSFILKSV